MEEFRQPVSVTQCFNCQSFGHSAKNCRSKQKCLICSESHFHKGCHNKEARKHKCANCKGPHVASYKGCPEYKKQTFRQHVANNQKSYAPAVGQKTLTQNGLVVNNEYRNDDFNIISDNEALAIELEIFKKQNFTLATIYCPNGNPYLSFFLSINNRSIRLRHVCRRFQLEIRIFRLGQEKHIWPYAPKYPKATKPYLLK